MQGLKNKWLNKIIIVLLLSSTLAKGQAGGIQIVWIIGQGIDWAIRAGWGAAGLVNVITSVDQQRERAARKLKREIDGREGSIEVDPTQYTSYEEFEYKNPYALDPFSEPAQRADAEEVEDELVEKPQAKSKEKPDARLPDSKKGWVRLKNGQGFLNKDDGLIYTPDKKHKPETNRGKPPHWDVNKPGGQRVKEVDYEGNEIWPNGPKNKNREPK